MSGFTSTDRPVIAITADKPTAWPDVAWGKHAGYVSWRVAGLGDQLNSSREAPVTMVRTEYVPGLDAVMLQASLPRTMPDMQALNWGVSGDANWRQVKTEATRQTWLKMGNSGGGSAISSSMWRLQPGVQIDIKLYDPPADQATAAYLRIGVLRFGSTTNYRGEFRFPTLPPRQLDGVGDGDPPVNAQPVFLPNPSSPGYIGSTYTGGWNPTPGATISLRVRVVRAAWDWLIVSGPGLGQPWCIPMEHYDSDSMEGRISVGHIGGMMAFHVTQLEYTGKHDGSYNGQVLYNGDRARTLPWVSHDGDVTRYIFPYTPPGLDHQQFVTDWFDNAITMKGTRFWSPVLYSFADWQPPTLQAVSSAPATVAHCTKLQVTLSGRRGHRCGLWFTRDSTAGTAFKLNGVVTVAAGWDSTGAVTLFKGRVAGPFRRRQVAGFEDPPQVMLASDDTLLHKKPMAAMTGAWAGQQFYTAFKWILNAGGVTDGRISTADDTRPSAPVLLSTDPNGLAFSPQTSIVRALDTICKARGFVWYCDRLGNYTAQPRPKYTGTPQGTLDETSTAFLGFVTELEHERALDGEYANSVIVDSTDSLGRRHGAWHATTTPITSTTDPSYVGVWQWQVDNIESSDPMAEARDRYRELSGMHRPVVWQTILDTGALLVPDCYVTVVHGEGAGLTAGTVLRVEQVDWIVDCESRVPMAIQQITAVVEEPTV